MGVHLCQYYIYINVHISACILVSITIHGTFEDEKINGAMIEYNSGRGLSLQEMKNWININANGDNTMEGV